MNLYSYDTYNCDNNSNKQGRRGADYHGYGVKGMEVAALVERF